MAAALPKAFSSAASSAVLTEAAQPTPAKQVAGVEGEAGNKDALARLSAAVKELRAIAAGPFLQRSIEALNRENFTAGGKWAIKALEQDEQNGVGWYLLGIARERAGDFENSVKAYEAALKLLPDQAEIANDLGRLGYRMGMFEQAEKLFRHYVEHSPEDVQGINNLASAIKERGRPDESIAMLKEAILKHPGSGMLWNTLGSVVMEEGDLPNAEIFFTEATRLEPKFNKARYNLSQVKQGLGDLEGALKDCEMAMKRIGTADDREMMRLARSSYLLGMSRLAEGWDDYEARLSPQFADVTLFAIDRRKWKPGADIRGKSFLVVAEQGLGDEILFANVLPDVVERMGPEGKLKLVVERRLVPLFQRTFPDAEVSSHRTYIHKTRPLRVLPDVDQETVDLWAPMGSLMREYRTSLDAFPDHKGYLKADPERVAHWKKALEDAPAGPKVGLLWKSATNKDNRSRFFSPFEQWEPVLRTPGVSFINLQYGDCSKELEQAERDYGAKIWQPQGIDLKLDLDDVAALCCAMDLVAGFANATFNIASACGTPSWLISTPGSWPRLGTDRYPWYPQSRVFLPERFGAWDTAMRPMAEALAEYAAAAK
jgi:cytochrome c-type biogenesis protein CcmH/NrfG